MKYQNNKPQDSEIMIYTTEDGLTKIETTFDGDTVWLSIDQMARSCSKGINRRFQGILRIFLQKVNSCEKQLFAKFATTAADGKTYQVEYYNLDVIISVGYRVKSKRGTQFRILGQSGF